MKKIILASASPRRHQLLELLKIKHQIIPCKEEEPIIANETTEENSKPTTIEEIVLNQACSKTHCIIKILSKKIKSNSIIVGADTIVVLENEIIGKPQDKHDALHMLKKLCGKTHEVYTGLCLYDSNSDKLNTSVVKTLVTMQDWNEEQLKKYIEIENVLDKAGAYAIQGIGAAIIEKIDGCFYNVMGLPLNRLVQMLESQGYSFIQEI